MRKLFDIPFWGRGFRPFFLLGSAYGVLSILFWSAFSSGILNPPAVLPDAIGWHAHEMLYGFTMAIVAGFLLTAVANWTAGTPVRQFHLAGLCLLWLAGRLVMNLELHLPAALVYTVELAFIPALAISLAIPLFHSRNRRNFIFLAMLTALFVFNLSFLLYQDITFLHLALLVILMMVSLIGGRIIPAFTVAALRRRGQLAFQTPQPGTDMAALVVLAALVLAIGLVSATSLVVAALSLVAGGIHLLRLRYYHLRTAFQDPMLWILHLGYLWLVVGLFLLAAAALNLLPLSIAFHALTVGTISTMILGMLCRVTLGHTGRDLHASKTTVLAFILLQVAALLRVGGAIAFPAATWAWLLLPALLWSASFALYLLRYTSMLLAPRPDGDTA